ncbi:MAG: glycosyltransferase family 4 protein [Holophagales bacterium]|nr:glycosyltransferase family 4 protein [Holophagales bacterium]
MASPLEVLISCSWWGGGLSVPVYFKALADELVDRGHRVTLVVTGGERPIEAGTEDRLEVCFWPDGRGASWRDGRFARRLLRRVRPDVCIANFSAVNLLMLLGKAHGVPVRIAYYHTLLEQVRADGGGRSLAGRLRIVRKAAIYRMATHLVAVSERAAEDLTSIYRLPAGRITCFHNAAPDPLEGEGPGIELGHSPSKARDPRAVAAIRLDPSKGPDLLLDAVAALHRDRAWPPDFGLEIYGEGPMRESCEARIERHGLGDLVRLPGRRPPAEVRSAMARARFTVLPSRSDNCPLAAIESLALGTPVVGARAGGIPELVDGKSGVLVQPGDAAALASALRALLHDPELCAELGRGARERFLTRFELRRAVARQADWLESLVPAQRTPPKRAR